MRPRLLLARPLVAALAAGGHTPAPASPAGVDNLSVLRADPATPMAVADFDADPKLDDGRLRGLRGSSMTGASDGLFSTYLQQAFEAELRQAGRLDPDADLQLHGTLVHNKLDASSGSYGRASVGARFVLRRKGEVVFDKVVKADDQWESSFIGAIAIPAGMQGYVATVQKLVGTVFADPDFVAASR